MHIDEKAFYNDSVTLAGLLWKTPGRKMLIGRYSNIIQLNPKYEIYVLI